MYIIYNIYNIYFSISLNFNKTRNILFTFTRVCRDTRDLHCIRTVYTIHIRYVRAICKISDRFVII